MVAGGMVNVRLPLVSLAGAQELQRLLRAGHDMELLVYELRGYSGGAGRIWCRVCAQVSGGRGRAPCAPLRAVPGTTVMSGALLLFAGGVCTLQVYLDKSDFEALAKAVLAELPAAMRVDEAVICAA